MPIDRRLPTLLQMLALAGAIGISGYLTYTKATNGIPPCTVGGGCAAALYSPWGYLAGIPLAYIGLTASIVLLLASPWRSLELRAVSFVLFLIGAIFTIYLRYVEQAHFNGHICAWCVSFMAFWWIAGAFELVRLIRQPGDAEPEAEPA
ncbi:MAG: vitamin K epoxide reductase family protein [Gaiellales bacterium]